jgi:hypothetical protein
VAAEIEGQDTLRELRMLFAAHGIGPIKLDATLARADVHASCVFDYADIGCVAIP